MNQEVYKYLVPFKEEVTLTLPIGANIIRVDSEDGHLYFWALVDTDASTEERKFYLSKTGGKGLPKEPLTYLGCGAIFIQQELMLYVFEKNTYFTGGRNADLWYVTNDCTNLFTTQIGGDGSLPVPTN